MKSILVLAIHLRTKFVQDISFGYLGISAESTVVLLKQFNLRQENKTCVFFEDLAFSEMVFFIDGQARIFEWQVVQIVLALVDVFYLNLRKFIYLRLDEF